MKHITKLNERSFSIAHVWMNNNNNENFKVENQIRQTEHYEIQHGLCIKVH